MGGWVWSRGMDNPRALTLTAPHHAHTPIYDRDRSVGFLCLFLVASSPIPPPSPPPTRIKHPHATNNNNNN